MLARANDASNEQYSRSIKLYRSRVLLRKWLLWKQYKSLKLEIFYCDSRMRLLKMINTVLARLASGRCLALVAPHGRFFSLVCRVLLLFSRWFCYLVFCTLQQHMFATVVAGSPRWKRVQYSKNLTHHEYHHRHQNHITAPKYDITKKCTPDLNTTILGAVPG